MTFLNSSGRFLARFEPKMARKKDPNQDHVFNNLQLVKRPSEVPCNDLVTALDC